MTNCNANPPQPLGRAEGKAALERKIWGCCLYYKFTSPFTWQLEGMPAPPQEFLGWNKVIFKGLSVTAVEALGRELEKLGVFWKLENQEVEGLLNFYIFVLYFKPSLNSGTEIHPTWNNTVDIIVLTQSRYRHWRPEFKLPSDCGGQMTMGRTTQCLCQSHSLTFSGAPEQSWIFPAQTASSRGQTE